MSGSLSDRVPPWERGTMPLELDNADRLAIAALQSPQSMNLSARIIREAAVLIPCAVILALGMIWNDKAALILGPGLYAGYQIYLSMRDQLRDRRIGQIFLRLEEEQAALAAIGPIVFDDEGLDEPYELDEGDPREEIVLSLERASEESEAAGEHFRVAAAHFGRRKIPRGSAHTLAALGHLRTAHRESRTAVAIHSDLTAGRSDRASG